MQVSSLPTECSFPVPQSKIQPGIPVRDDSFGNFVGNQFLWEFPGIDHLAHGFNIFTGTEMIPPIFHFTYCGGDKLRTFQDVYRGNTYQIPFQVIFYR